MPQITHKNSTFKTHLILPNTPPTIKQTSKQASQTKTKTKTKGKKKKSNKQIPIFHMAKSKSPASKPFTSAMTTRLQPPNIQETEPLTPAPSAKGITSNERARYNHLRGTIFCFTHSLAEILNSWNDGVKPRLFHEKLHTIRVEVADIAGLAMLENASFRELCGRLEECLNRLEALNDVVRENLPCGWEGV